MALKESNLVQDSLNKEISALRNELQRALEEVIISKPVLLSSKIKGKRARDEERVTGLEERNRLNQRIEMLEGRTQKQQDRIAKRMLLFHG